MRPAPSGIDPTPGVPLEPFGSVYLAGASRWDHEASLPAEEIADAAAELGVAPADLYLLATPAVLAALVAHPAVRAADDHVALARALGVGDIARARVITGQDFALLYPAGESPWAAHDRRRIFLTPLRRIPYIEIDPSTPGFDASPETVGAAEAALREGRDDFPPGYRLRFVEYVRRLDLRRGASAMTRVPSVETTIRWLAWFHPERGDALHHLFAVVGNGYEWHRGGLVSRDGPRGGMILTAAQWRAWRARVRDDARAQCRHHKALAGAGYDGPDPDATDDDEFDRQDAAWLRRSPRPGPERLYPLSEHSALLLVPPDVRPDWLAAAREAVVLFRSERYVRTAEDETWLDRAEERLGRAAV